MQADKTSANKIKVDIVCPTGGQHGGIENVIRSWTRYLDQDVFDLRVFHCTPGIGYLDGYSKTYFITEKHDNIDASYIASCYYSFISNFGTPDICIACNWPMVTRACAAVNQTVSSHFKVLSWLHTGVKQYEENDRGTLEDLAAADGHLVLTGQTAGIITERFPDANVHVIGNPISFVDAFNEASNLANRASFQKDSLLNLTYVGRLDVMKRIDLILEAMYRSKANCHLDIIGDGDIKDDILNWISMLKLEDKVSLHGWQRSPWKCCENSSILVMASEYEGLSMTAIEAAYLGKTIVTTPVDGMSDFIKEGESGYFFDFDDAAGLALIFDKINDGTFKICNPKICHHSVDKYSVDTYFASLKKILSDYYPS